jgi:hypothetical protein
MGNSASISPMNQHTQRKQRQYAFFPSSSAPPSLQSYLRDQLLEDFAEKQQKAEQLELFTSVLTEDENDCDSDNSALFFDAPMRQKKEPAGFRTPVRERVRKDSITAVIRYWNEPDGEASTFRNQVSSNPVAAELVKAVETAAAAILNGKEASSIDVSSSSVSLSDRMENIEFCQLLRKILVSFSTESPIETDLVNALLFRLDCMEEITSDETELRDELLLDIKNDLNQLLLTPIISSF